MITALHTPITATRDTDGDYRCFYEGDHAATSIIRRDPRHAPPRFLGYELTGADDSPWTPRNQEHAEMMSASQGM